MTDIDKLFKFMDNMNMKYDHVSNVYVAKTYTSDNVCTGEYYGMNLLTDYGFSQFFGVDGTPAFPTQLYVGDGTASFDKTTNIMTSVLFNGLAGTNQSTTVDHSYPLYFAPGESLSPGRVTTVSRFLITRYPENISGVSANVAISEYGIGTSPSALWTHSFVYDNLGDRASIIKRPGERLDIEVYFCCSYLESVIMNGWNNGNYSVITTGNLMLDRMNIPTVSVFRRTNHSGTSGKVDISSPTRSRSAIIDSTITKTVIMPEVFISSAGTKYIDGFSCSDTGFLSLHPQQLSVAEQFTTDPVFSYNPRDLYGFEEMFGRELPFTQADITSIVSYNYKTGAWTDTHYFNIDTDSIFDETPMSTAYAVPLVYTNNNSTETLYIYQNLKTTDPIVKIRGNVQTLYATDKYWHGPNIPNSDWIQITDRNNIPSAAQTKRYWISSSNQINLDPARVGSFYLKTNVSDTGYETTPSEYTNIVNGTYLWGMKNDAYGTMVMCSYSEYRKLQIFSLTENYYESFAFGRNIYDIMTYGKFAVVDTDQYTSVYDLSTISQRYIDPATTLTITTISYGNRYSTTNEQGIFCSLRSNNKLAIIDFRTPTLTVTELSNVKVGCCMWKSAYVAYVPTDESKLIIYDTTTSTNAYEFNIPSGFTGIGRVMAHTNYVILASSSTTYVCDITTGTFTDLETVLSIDRTNGPIVRCFDNIMVLCHDGSNGNPYQVVGLLFENGNVTVRTIQTGYDGRYYRFAHTTPFLVGNTLLLEYSHPLYSGANLRNTIYDFGYFMKTGDLSLQYEYNWEYDARYFLYGDYAVYESIMIPLVDYLPIKISGTTKTISSINNTKSVRSKTFEVSFSNTPTFSGKPPGSSN